MARTAQPATKGARKSPAAPAKKKSASTAAKTSAKVKKAPVRAATATAKKTGITKKASSKKPVAKPAKAVAKRPVKAVTGKTAKSTGKSLVKKAGKKTTAVPKKKTKSVSVERYRCRLCGYIYSPLRGEPHNGIPAGTAFDDLPDSYVCPVCGQQGKGKIGKWGFDPWRPTRYICSICGYVYDEKRGEPHREIRPGTKFDDLPDDYTCPVCAIDPKISVRFGKVFRQGFEPLQVG
jgi:rubredoxin